VLSAILGQLVIPLAIISYCLIASTFLLAFGADVKVLTVGADVNVKSNQFPLLSP